MDDKLIEDSIFMDTLESEASMGCKDAQTTLNMLSVIKDYIHNKLKEQSNKD